MLYAVSVVMHFIPYQSIHCSIYQHWINSLLGLQIPLSVFVKLTHYVNSDLYCTYYLVCLPSCHRGFNNWCLPSIYITGNLIRAKTRTACIYL